VGTLLLASIVCFNLRQVITASHDTTVRLWDLAAGRSMATLTNHKKSVRSLVVHPTLWVISFISH